ncbi:type II toxin-antitoxin system RelE/ParE family toxin [Flavobacterium sp.]|jgi:mRNA interferase RelE/StbE|uniref:type II toxin-antitoxin system RelE/ParE family toxin n=1 Tax=Flavobacterium sp. TaxID=239 RepID=UPI0037BF5D99
MEVDFTRNFLKNLENLKNEDLLQKIQDTIDDVVRANSVLEISNIKKLSGFKVYYRIKIGDYRIGIEKIGKQIKFLTFEHRKDIYKKFP